MIVKKLNDFLNESVTSKELLTLNELKEKFPKMKFTMDVNNNFRKPNGEKAYFVRVDIETQGGELEYLGALKGPVSEKHGLEFLNNIANRTYDKYY